MGRWGRRKTAQEVQERLYKLARRLRGLLRIKYLQICFVEQIFIKSAFFKYNYFVASFKEFQGLKDIKANFGEMEKLNGLGSSLPPEQPPTDQAIASLNADLSQEFKIAANAVTKLYRVANERNSLLKHHGYINCLDDILKILQETPDITVDDIHLWCLKQKNDMFSLKTHNGSNAKLDFNFDSGSDNSGLEIHVPKFSLSKPPLSVEHHYNQHHGHAKPKKVRPSTAKKQQTLISQQNQQDAWKPISKYAVQKPGSEDSQGEDVASVNTRPYAGTSRLSAIKKQKASVPPTRRKK